MPVNASLAAACAAGAAVILAAAPSRAAECGDLAALHLPDTVIKSARSVPAGGLPELGGSRRPDLPAFCRVVASVRAARDSDVGVEVWLPLEGWTGVFHGNGNGGFGGVLSAGYAAMGTGLRRGYVTAVTDMGTAPATPLDGDALAGHPRKWRDWGRLSTHAMTVIGKALAQAFYGRPAARAYYTGCSSGGQEGLVEAMFYPGDYDGVLVGAPVIDRTWGHAAVLWDALATDPKLGAPLDDAKLRLLNRAVLAACGGRGGGAAGDPYLTDPQACHFDPAALACAGADTGACLTPGEVRAARAFYSGPTDHAGRALFYGWPRGGEAPDRFGWDFLQSRPKGEPAFDSLFKWVFGPGWDWRSFDPARDMARVDAVLGPAVNDATRGDLAAFHARGGKLIVYQGWADSLVPPAQTVAFYDRVARAAGGVARAQAFARLFMAPGVGHCGSGPGPDGFNAANGAAGPPASQTPRDDLFAALAAWVEHGEAPSQVIATRWVDGLPARGVATQRPICAYPARAWPRPGGGASAFVCSVRRPGAGARDGRA